MVEINVKTRIKELMDQRGMKLSDLAVRCDWPISKMSKVLNGDQRVSVDDIVKIGEALGTNPALLITHNLGDAKEQYKSSLPLSEILGRIGSYTSSIEQVVNLLRNELTHTIYNYLALGETGKSIDVLVDRVGKAELNESGLKQIPRVLISDKQEGQLFGNQLTIGYWFTTDCKIAYLAIHYMRRSDYERRSPIAINDMREYFRIFTSGVEELKGEEIMDFGQKDRETRILSAGTIFCKRYILNTQYRESLLKYDLHSVYNAYLKLLNEATKRVQLTYENIYQSLREQARKASPENEKESFEKADLDRIMPIKLSANQMVDNRLKAMKKALERENCNCEIDNKHTTFTDRITGKPYMETRLLIPYLGSNGYKHIMGVDANICCLCPTCNAKLDHASDAERQELLMQLYMKHKDGLLKAGISITPMQLFKMYDMN